jgi:tetratricopeptide (TPR) repeat protein
MDKAKTTQNETDSQIQRANMLVQTHRLDDAETLLRQILAQEPENARAHLLLASVLSTKQVDRFTHTALQTAGNSDTWIQRLDWQMEAIQEARLAASLEPNWSLPHAMLSMTLSSSQAGRTSQQINPTRLDESLAEAQEALRLEPDSRIALLALTQAHTYRKEWKEALDATGQILKQEPQQVRALNLRSKALLMLGRYEETADIISQILTLDPTHNVALARWGWVKLMQGNPSEAERLFREGLKLDPTFRWNRQGLKYAQISKIHPLLLKLIQWVVKKFGPLNGG